MATIAVLGTLDTMGEEHAYVAERIRQRGHTPLLMDVGTLEVPKVAPDVGARCSRPRRGGPPRWRRRDRGEAVAAMTRGLIVPRSGMPRPDRWGHFPGGWRRDGDLLCGHAAFRGWRAEVDGVHTRERQHGPYVGVKGHRHDAQRRDVAGLNRLAGAAGAGGGRHLRDGGGAGSGGGPGSSVIVASQFGNDGLRHGGAAVLEAAGFEVMILRRRAAAGTMESPVESGLASRVSTSRPTEWADELVGGVDGGPTL